MKTKTQFTNRILSLVLALVMVLGMVPMTSLTAHAAYGYDEETKFAFQITDLVMVVDGETYEKGESGSAFYEEQLTKLGDGKFQYTYKAALSANKGPSDSYGGTLWSDMITVNFDGVDCDTDYEKIIPQLYSTHDGYSYTWNLVVSKSKGHVYGSWSDNGDGTHTRTCVINSAHKETASHNYAAATCSAPETCKDCGATQGESVADAHSWNAATCVLPQTCKYCGITQGEVLGHNMVAATFGNPAACSRCGATDINISVLEAALINTNVNLPSKAIKDDNAGYIDITWSVVDAGSTGATINGNTLKASYSGEAVIRATIESGSKDFTVLFKNSENIDIGLGSVTVSQKDASTLTVTYAGFEGGSKDYMVGEPLQITGTTTSNYVEVSSGSATIILNDVSISRDGYCFRVNGGATANLTLVGSNALSTGTLSYAALSVPENATVIIDGEGTLTATSSYEPAAIGSGSRDSGTGTIVINGGTIIAKNTYTGLAGAGIGGQNRKNGGNIIINGGVVTATGGEYAAGIGGGNGENGGEITINGGTVTATGGKSAAGIGGGYVGGDGGQITITGGTVIAKGGNSKQNFSGAGIGGGYKGNGGTVVITGGNIKATAGSSNAEAIGKGYNGESSGTLKDANGNDLSLQTITLSGAAANTAVTATEGITYGLTSVKTLDTNKLYFYLPAESVADSFTADGTVYDCTADNKTYYTSHDWSKNDGVCARCGETCEHENQTGSTCEICGIALHTHRWEYETDGTTITASCTADGCTNTNGGSVTIVAPTELTYNGTAKEATYTGALATGDAINIVYASTTDELVGEKPVHAGDYTASTTIGEVTASVDFTIEKATPVVTPPTPREGLSFNNVLSSLLAQNPQTTGGTLMYKVNDGEWGDSTVIRKKWPAGTYNVYWKVVGDENYESVDTGAYITVTILHQELDKINPTVTLSSESFVYDGTAKMPAVSIVTGLPYISLDGSNVTNPDETLEEGKDFTVTYSDNVNAGTATVTIQGIGNFKGTVTKTFTITDKTIPTGTILIKENGWNKFWNTITFGIFCKDYVDVTVTADGTGSGVAKVEYLLSGTVLEENNIPVDGWTTLNADNGSYRFSIQPQSKVAVYVRITDEAGNETVINSDGIVVYEDSKAVDTEVTYTYKENSNKDIAVAFNGNTVKSIVCGEKTLAANSDYTVDYESGKIVLTSSYLDTLNAGNYTFTVSYNPMGIEDSGVTDLTTTFMLVIDKVDGKVSNINISGKTYDGTAVTAPIYDKLGNGVVTIEYKVKGADDSTYTTTAPKNAGDYVVLVTAAEGTNHKAASATAEFSITPASIENAEVTLDPKTVVYNGSEHKPAVTVTWNGITLTENTDYVVYYRNNVNASDATVLGIVYVVGTNNFEGSIEKEFEITYAQLTEVEVKQQGTLTYNGQEQTPVVSVNAKSVDGCPVTFTYRTSPHDTYGTMPGFTGAGTYTVYFKASAQNHNDYYGSFDVTIAKKAVTVTANDASKTYGDSDPALTYTHTELIGSDALDITVSRASGENANTYTITASQTEGANPNYEITFKTGTFTIHKAALTVTAEDKTATYGDAVPNYTVKYEGFKNGDDKDDLGGALAFECDYAQFSDKGEYTVKASGYTSGNYTISYVDGKLTVNAKPITVTIQNATSVYGDTLAELKATDNGIVNGDANVYSLATTATGTSNAGKYAITGTALDSNYDVTFVNGEYEITKREITITVDAKNTVVNTTLPTYTYKVEGLVGMDTLVTMPTLTCNANIAVIGEYDITASGADAGDNYSIKYVPAKLTVLTDNAVDAAAGYIEELKDYDPATVTSEDKAELEEMLSEIETILDDENITDNGKKALEEVKELVEKLIKEITDAAEATDTENTEKVENVTPENVTPENKTDLEGAKADLEKALEDNGGNYTEDEKKAIEDEIKRIDDALEVIGNVEAVEELIDKLPENITKNDEDAIKAADDAYNALSDYEKSLVDEDAKKALANAKAVLAELNKPADPNSPATGDNSNMFLWIALLFISGGAVITLTVVDRKKRMASKR